MKMIWQFVTKENIHFQLYNCFCPSNWCLAGQWVFMAKLSIAVHSPQCHSAQHVITIALSTCNLLAHPFLDGKGCQLVLEQCRVMYVPAVLLPVQGWEEGHGCSDGHNCSDSCLRMNMCIFISAGLPCDVLVPHPGDCTHLASDVFQFSWEHPLKTGMTSFPLSGWKAAVQSLRGDNDQALEHRPEYWVLLHGNKASPCTHPFCSCSYSTCDA